MIFKGFGAGVYLLSRQESVILLVVLPNIDELHTFEVCDLDPAGVSAGGQLMESMFS